MDCSIQIEMWLVKQIHYGLSRCIHMYMTVVAAEFNADKMYFVIAGDAKTQLRRIKELGYGSPIMLDREGNTIK